MRKRIHSVPFSAVPPAVKGDTGGSILSNNGLLQSNQPADRYKYCPSWKQASFRHKISIVNYNYGGFQDETISGAARRASIQRAVFPAAAEVADAGSHGRAHSHIQPRIQRSGTREVRCLRPDPAVSLFHAGGGCRVNRKIISCSLFMGKNNRALAYCQSPLFFAKKQNSAISVSITGIEQFYYNFYYKRGKTYREREGNAS